LHILFNFLHLVVLVLVMKKKKIIQS